MKKLRKYKGLKKFNKYILGKDGFTLAELLIVVAIIGVLVATSIPVFASQLEKSRESTDLANVRGAYSQVALAALSENGDEMYNGEIIHKKDGDKDVYTAKIPLKQKKQGWNIETAYLSIGGVKYSDSNWINEPDTNGLCTISICDGLTTIDWGGTAIQFVSLANYSDTIRTAISNFFINNSFAISCWDSTYPNANSYTCFKDIKNALNGDENVKTWTVINSKASKDGDRFSSSNTIENKGNSSYFEQSEKDLYYIWTGIDINDASMHGKKVPVMVCYTNDVGEKVYSVTDITVEYGDNRQDGLFYNVLSTYYKNGSKKRMQKDYDVNELLGLNGTRKDFSTNYKAACTEYMKRLDNFQ